MNDPYADPNCDQSALEQCRDIREEWKTRQPDPTSVHDVMRLLRKWRASPEHEECRRVLAGEMEEARV